MSDVLTPSPFLSVYHSSLSSLHEVDFISSDGVVLFHFLFDDVSSVSSFALFLSVPVLICPCLVRHVALSLMNSCSLRLVRFDVRSTCVH